MDNNEIKASTPKPDLKRALSSGAATLALMLNDKGGVGKSTATAALLEFNIEMGLDPVPIDLDKGNADFAKAYLPKDYKPPSIDSAEGFRHVYDRLREAPKDRPVVVSTPAQFLTRAQEHNAAFLDILPTLSDDLGRQLRLIFITDDKRDSVNYLIEVEKHFGSSKIDVIRNNFFAKPDGFEFFNKSKLHDRIIKAGGQVIDFPVLAGRLAQKINVKRWSRAQCLQELDSFDRLEYLRWWKTVMEAFTRAGYTP